MAMTAIQKGQLQYLMRGGTYKLPLRMLREKGILPEEGNYVRQEYPKALNLSLGVHEFPMQTETARKDIIHWTEEREVICPMIVQDEAEEDAVVAAFDRAKDLGVVVKEDWTPALLLHTVQVAPRTDQLRNAPKPSPEQIRADLVAALKAELAALEPAPETVEAAAPSSTPRRRGTPAAELPVVAPDPEA